MSPRQFLAALTAFTLTIALSIGMPFAASAGESHSAPAHKGVDAETALRWLRNGNTRFLKGTLRKDGQSQADIKKLSKGQTPHSIILSCSDSRVPPEALFDQKLGEIFVIRTAGEALDSTAIASIEYAIEHLGTHNIVVLGHTQCGAVKAALATLHGEDAGSESLNYLVRDIHPRLKGIDEKQHSADYSKEAKANVDGVIQDLATRSTIVAKHLKDKSVKISGALYHVESGEVTFY